MKYLLILVLVFLGCKKDEPQPAPEYDIAITYRGQIWYNSTPPQTSKIDVYVLERRSGKWYFEKSRLAAQPPSNVEWIKGTKQGVDEYYYTSHPQLNHYVEINGVHCYAYLSQGVEFHGKNGN